MADTKMSCQNLPFQTRTSLSSLQSRLVSSGFHGWRRYWKPRYARARSSCDDPNQTNDQGRRKKSHLPPELRDNSASWHMLRTSTRGWSNLRWLFIGVWLFPPTNPSPLHRSLSHSLVPNKEPVYITLHLNVWSAFEETNLWYLELGVVLQSRW